MSRGLGKIERLIVMGCPITGVESFALQIDHERWLADNGLSCQNSRECCDDGPYAVGKAWPSTLESVRRALRSLHRKGLIEMEWRGDAQEYGGPYRPSFYRYVSLTEPGREAKRCLDTTLNSAKSA